MGEHEGPSRLVLNGVLSSESSRSVLCPLNAERWSRAEERTTELIACIQPNAPSEERRNDVAHYVQRLIMKCFPCQVFTFGSVPLKTYLPDGDIDLSVFSNNPNFKDTWATLVRDILESEEKNESAEFCVKEVQYIQAEVKIIKCLVETIVVDISFNQLGGLCTLCFLEEVDHLINQNHLFKRSIILIKAWCYYESRILGAHHGLISTYALETLVLYIFHIFNNSFAGPLEVLYRFLEFFNSFDWDQFCVSLWGPIPICSLPDFTPYPPLKDCGELLLTSGFLEKCNAAYADFPTSQENHGQPFMSKHFNIIDPLRVNNNLGRSVSKGNFFRIRSAFAFGAKRLAKLLYCPQEDIVFELNRFFANTWERHGSGVRPDAPTPSLQNVMPLNVDQSHGLIKHVSMPMKKKRNERSFGHASIVEGMKNPYACSTKSSIHSSENTNTKNENNSKIYDQAQRSLKLEKNVNEYIQGKYLFARTRSSPELTETYSDTSSQGRPNKATGSVEQNHASLTKAQNNRRRINGVSGSTSTQASISSIDDHGHVNSSEEWASVAGAQGMLQEEQDLVNMISSSVNNFGGQFPIPLNMSSTNLPLPFSPSMLASIGHARRNMVTLMPENISIVDPTNVSFPQGMVQSPLLPYFYGIGGLSSKAEDPAEQVNGKCGEPTENVLGNTNSEFLHERDGSSSGHFVHDDENMVCVTNNNKQPSTSKSSGFVQPSRHCGKSFSKGSCDGSSSKGPKITKDKRGMKSTMYGKGKHVFEPASTNVEDEGGDCNQVDTTSNTEMGERSSVVYLPRHMLFGGYEAAQTNGSNSFLPMDPQMALGPGSHHRIPDGSGSHPFSFYPTGPHVPYVTMLPFYNFPLDVNSSDAQLVSGTSTRDESCDKVDDDLKALNESSSTGRSIPEEPKDILNSDFLSHWHNLQYGRSCQNPRLVYPSPVILPLGYIQGGALGTNMNMFSQVTSYSPHLATFHPMSDHTLASDYQEMPRYRTGTGTYLPNHKASRDRHSSGTRRNNYNYDRNDHRGDREGNWNTTKSRVASRNHHNRNQTDKSSSRLYRQTSSTNVGTNPNRVSSNGHVVPTTPMVMFYQYDDTNSSSQGASPSEALEFESVDHPMGFMRSNKVAQHVMEGARARGTFEDHSFHTSSQRSSPNQSSVHHVQRRT